MICIISIWLSKECYIYHILDIISNLSYVIDMNLSSYFIFISIDMLYVYYELINDVYITYNMYLTYVISNIIMYNYYHTLLYDIIQWYLSYIIYSYL